MTVKAKIEIENGILPTLCRQCNMRCGVNFYIANGKIAEIKGNKAHPQYRGGICALGRVAAELAYHPDRLHHPLSCQDQFFMPGAAAPSRLRTSKMKKTGAIAGRTKRPKGPATCMEALQKRGPTTMPAV